MRPIAVKNAEFAALCALKAGAGPACLGFHFDRGLSGGVTVTHAGEPLGAWRFVNGQYAFCRMRTERVVARAASPDQVVSRTIAMAARLPAPGSCPQSPRG